MNTRQWVFALAAVAPACDCDSSSYVDASATVSEAGDVSTSTGDVSTSTWGATGAITGSAGAPFDASRWVGRYHYLYPLVDRWGEQSQTTELVNFEFREDGTMTMLYDRCSFDWPEIVHYEWEPDEEPGWIELHPGAGQPYLRFLVDQPYESIRVHLIEPCRELEFEVDGNVDTWLLVYPGAWCWLNRCGNGIRVDYCEGEEPPPCP
jgi:hypothetical protein